VAGVSFVYTPRQPTAGVLHEVGRRHLRTFLALVAGRTDGAGVPGFVAPELPGLPLRTARAVPVQEPRRLSVMWRAPNGRACGASGRSRHYVAIPPILAVEVVVLDRDGRDSRHRVGDRLPERPELPELTPAVSDFCERLD